MTIVDKTRKPTVREAMYRFLREKGVTTIFGNPGSTELAMFRDFPEDFQYILGLQESVVVGMADGYAQASRNAAIVNLHSAVGIGHAMGNIFTAYRNQTPLIVTVGQQARSILPYEPFLGASQPELMPQPYVKWAIQPARGEDVPQAIARAYHIAMQAPRGPVMVSVPADDWDKESDWVECRDVSYDRAVGRDEIKRVAERLDQAKTPYFVVGAGVDRDLAVDAVVDLAERHQAKVFVAPMSARCSFPEKHPLFGGFLPAMRERIVNRLSDADLILVLGAPAFTYHVHGDGPHIPEHAELIQIVDNPDVAAWTPCGQTVVASLHLALEGLLEFSAPAARPAPLPKPDVPEAQPSMPMTEQFALQSLARARPLDSVVVEEAPGSRSAIHDYLPMQGQESFYTMASGGLGYSMPAAIGVALARKAQGKQGRVIALIGDGSSMYSIQALWTAKQLNLPISFVILNNQRYAALQDFAPVYGFEAGEHPVGTDLPELDFVLLAEGQGVQAARVEDPALLAEALTKVLSDEGPSLLEITIL